jgi:hypothetical protein
MSSDGRYMYQHQQGMTSYDYSSYPPQLLRCFSIPPESFQATEIFSITSFLRACTVQSSAAPLPRALWFCSLTPFRIRLRLSGMAKLGPSLANQWHQHRPSPTHPLPPLSRPEPAPAPPAPAPAPAPAPTPTRPSQRVYAPSPQPQPNTEMRRAAGTPKAADPPPQQKRKPREKEVAAPRHPSPLASTPLDIDFGKACSLNVRFSIDSFTDVDDLLRVCVRIYETL